MQKVQVFWCEGYSIHVEKVNPDSYLHSKTFDIPNKLVKRYCIASMELTAIRDEIVKLSGYNLGNLPSA